MYKIAVISDTHQNTEYINLFLDQIKTDTINEIIHLGDFYNDVDFLSKKSYLLTRVPGTWTSFYKDPQIINRQIITRNQWRIFLTHTPTRHNNDLPGDPNPEEIIKNKKCDIMLYGHTHKPIINKIDEITCINPGHLKEKISLGSAPTYAILTLLKDTFEVTIIELLTGNLFKKS